MLGVGLTCALLFFVDGLSASMTRRAVAPLPLDMQRVLTEPVAGDVRLSLQVEPLGAAKAGDTIQVRLELKTLGETPANDDFVRSVPAAGLTYVKGSAVIDGEVVTKGENPFASGPAKAGLNLGTLTPGSTVRLDYQATISAAQNISEQTFVSTSSSRESLIPVVANAGRPMSLEALATQLRTVNGVAFAEQLSFADLPRGALSADVPTDAPNGVRVGGAVRVFGFEPSYMKRDSMIKLVAGTQVVGEALIGAEAGTAAVAGCCVGLPVGLVMAFYLINVLRPLFVLNPPYFVPLGSLSIVVWSILVATAATSVAASSLVNRLRATKPLRDE